jgi:hypothetical protein
MPRNESQPALRKAAWVPGSPWEKLLWPGKRLPACWLHGAVLVPTKLKPSRGALYSLCIRQHNKDVFALRVGRANFLVAGLLISLQDTSRDFCPVTGELRASVSWQHKSQAQRLLLRTYVATHQRLIPFVLPLRLPTPWDFP